MILRVLGGALSGALVLMLSGYVYWDLLLPSGTALRDVPDQAGLARALGEFLPGAGTYFIPHGSPDGENGHNEESPHAAAMAEVNPDDKAVKIILCGDSAVGKSKWVSRCVARRGSSSGRASSDDCDCWCDGAGWWSGF